MLELNKWFFAQLANFLILLLLLNIILFKPLLQLFKERESRTKGFLDNAKATDKEKEILLSQIEKKLSEASEEAKKVREALRGEGARISREVLEGANKDAAELNKKAKKDLEGEVKKAKGRLKSDIKTFANKIVEKMIGV